MKYGNLLVFKDFFWICRLQETSKEVLMVPKAGLEPARISTVDFESTASTDFARDLDIDDSIPWVILEGIPPTDLFEIYPLRPSQAFGMFMERFKELTEL